MKITLKYLLDVICAYYEITPEKLFSMSRERYLVEKRMMFFYLAKQHVNASLLTITTFVTEKGRRQPINHATVIHSQKTIANLKAFDERITREVEELTEKLTGANPLVVKDVNLLSVCERYTSLLIA